MEYKLNWTLLNSSYALLLQYKTSVDLIHDGIEKKVSSQKDSTISIVVSDDIDCCNWVCGKEMKNVKWASKQGVEKYIRYWLS